MHRLYCPGQKLSENKIIVCDKEKVHYLKNVLRLKVGDEMIIFNEKGSEYTAKIEKLSFRDIAFKIKKIKKIPPAQKCRVTVACAVPKKSKMEDITDKLTQLGVDRIIPLRTKRVIVKWDKNKAGRQLERLRRIALEASQQSSRNNLPKVDSLTGIKELLSVNLENFDLKLIPTLEGERKLLKDVFSQSKHHNILILIGPEGDFTPEEIALAEKKGFIPVSLGDLVLRVETAAIAVASFIRLYENS